MKNKIAGLFAFIIFAAVLTGCGDERTGTQAPVDSKPGTQLSPTESKHAEEVEAAIELCKAATIKRQPNASGFVPHAYEVSEKQSDLNELHVQIGWGLAYDAAPAMVSDCRVGHKSGNLTLAKIKLSFAD